MRIYKTIQFSEGLAMPLAEFKGIYEKTYCFRTLNEKDRDKELEKAYKIATDGNIKTSSKKRKESEPDSVGEPTVQSDQNIGEDNTETEQEADI